MDAKARRAAAVSLYASRYRFVPKDRIRELNLEGLADSEIARILLISHSTAKKYRARMGLPVNLSRVRELHVAAGKKGPSVRDAAKKERLKRDREICRMSPSVTALGVRVVELLTDGALTRVAIGVRTGMSPTDHGWLAKELRRLRRQGVLVRGSRETADSLAPWSLAPGTVRAMYTPGPTLSPLQQKLTTNIKANNAVRMFSLRYSKAVPYLEYEIRSAAYEGLIAAARTYNPDKGRMFSSHAYQRVRGWIINALRVHTAYRYRRTDPKVLSGWTGDGVKCPADIKSVPADQHIRTDSENQFEDLIRCVSGDRDKEIMRLRFVQDMTIYEIADRVGLSYTRVYQIVTDTLDHMKGAVPCPVN